MYQADFNYSNFIQMYPRQRVFPHVFTSDEDQLLVKLRQSAKYKNWNEIAVEMKKRGYRITGKQCRCRWYTKLKQDLQVDISNWNDKQINSILKFFEKQGPQISRIAAVMRKKQKQVVTFMTSFIKKSVRLLQQNVRQKLYHKLVPLQARQYRIFFNMIMSKYHTKKKGSQQFRRKVFQIFRQINAKCQFAEEQIKSIYDKFNEVRKKYIPNGFQQSHIRQIKKQQRLSIKQSRYGRQIQYRIYELFKQYGKKYSLITQILQQELGRNKLQKDDQQYSQHSEHHKTQKGRVRQFLITGIRDGIYVLYTIGLHYGSQYTRFLKQISKRTPARFLIGMNNPQSLSVKQELIKLRFDRKITLDQFNKLAEFLYSQKSILTKKKKTICYSNLSESSNQSQQQQSNFQTKEDNVNNSKSIKVQPTQSQNLNIYEDDD